MDDSVVQAVEAMYASSSTGQTRSAADAFLRSFQTSPNAFAVSHAFLANAPTTARVVQLFAAQTISHLTLTPAQVSQLSSLFSLHHHERDIVRLLGTALVRNMEAGQGLDWLIQGPWDADVRISLLTLAAVESVAYTEAQNVIVYLGSSHAATKDTLLCMAEWVKLLDRDARHPDLVIKNPLTTYAIQVLHRGLDDTSDLFDAAVDLVVEVIRTYNSTLVDLPVIQWLIPQLMQLKPLFTAAAAQVAAITIPFWFAFTEALRFVPDVHQKQTLLRNFAPSLTNLSRICMHTMCFRDGFRELPSDKQQDFKNFRMELGDILQDCCVLLGTDLVLAHCVQGLHAILTDPDSSPDAQWESIEAHLYSFRSIARQVELQLQDSAKAGHPPMDETPLHTIFAFLPRFPAHPAIQYTSCLVISRYAEWLAGAGAAYLASLLTFVDATVTMSATRHDYHDWYGRLFNF
ncbi:hypothetical protein DYB37_009960 [Aphanomyces astaci]|uniref:Exportin-1/Importin-beta-like domain-containing protein n=2 Tax=Aphanomyces astaci TaxID=112090 RepID=A0A3R6XQX7_APHAT|nr:hypothetical protein DYB37_009960 [Aphanomyces astaci]